jgi:thioredoxin reductase (NADPH)
LEEEALVGRGVAYCATCDAPFYKDMTVAVVGGGNTAVEDALYMQRFAKKVYIIHRRGEFRASKILSDKIKASKDIEILFNCEVKKLKADKKLKSIEVYNNAEKRTFVLEVDGLFVATGQEPNTLFLKGLVALNAGDYIVADRGLMTNIEGIFSAGDCNEKELRQIVTACADGAVAAESALKLLNS